MCIGLKTIEIPESVTAIDSNAFRSCVSLKEIKLPDGLEKFGDNVFYDCKKIKAEYNGKVYQYKQMGELYAAVNDIRCMPN